MSANSKIEWCDHTFNPWIGCTKVSPGCAHCYAEARDQRFAGGVHWGKGAARKLTSEANWRELLKWNAAAQARRPRVFCASLADWLDDEVPIEWLARLLALIHATPNLDWLLLTKRPGNFAVRVVLVVAHLAEKFSKRIDAKAKDDPFILWLYAWTGHNPPANVWLGTTVEDQVRADERIPQLLAIPAKVRFLSCEPLLGPVDIAAGLPIERHVTGDAGIDWVIAGGESGPGARPMHPDWARGLRDQCAAAGVPFLFKQWGEFRPATSVGEATNYPILVRGPKKTPGDVVMSGCFHLDHQVKANLDGGSCSGGQCAMVRVGKHAAGRLLDGIEHHSFPANAKSSDKAAAKNL